MSTPRYPHVRAALFGTPWAILPEWMRAITEVVELRLDGGRLTESEIADRISAAGHSAGPRSRGGARRDGAIAVIPIWGVIARHPSVFESTSSSGTAVTSLRAALREAVRDQDVTGILLDVWSPGGTVSGVPELAEEIRAARGEKPILAISNDLNASAAYWISSQADEISVSPHSYTGSIGVVMAHEDITAMLEQEGVRVTLIHAGEHKVEGYPEIPLSEDARAYMQSMVDATYGMFLDGVAAGRGVSSSKVRADFGKGRVLNANDAVAAGLADRVETFDQAMARLADGKVRMRPLGGRAEGSISGGEAYRLAVSELAERSPETDVDRMQWQVETGAAPTGTGENDDGQHVDVDHLKRRQRAHAR